jgi:hypothetical protein
MTNVFVEVRPKNRPGGDPIADYVVENEGGSELHSSKTQAEAVAWGKSNGHHPLVARVRHRDNDKKVPDHWRSAG